jgi:NCS1 family nucleobase:cation symporter-1
VETAAQPDTLARQASPRLYNADLAPTTERRWGAFSMTSVWFACMHNMGQYTMAAGLMFLGLNPLEVLVGCFIGFLVCYAGAQLVGRAGQRHGISYPVLARASFGVFGANLPALIRAVVAVAWYGIQTYLASRAVIVLLVTISPGIAKLDTGGVLGLSPLGWICFLALWLLQTLVVTHGMETVRKFQNYAGAVISLLMLSIAVTLVIRAHGHLNFALGHPMSVGSTINHMFTDAGLWVATFATLMLNLCDFSRMAPSMSAVRKGNFWGLPVNGLLFMGVIVLNTVAATSIYGKPLTDPTELLAATGNRVLILVGAVLFIFATIGVNVIANIVSPAFDLANVFPRALNFKRGALLACVLALLVMPWRFYNSTVAINYFLGSLGAFLGPLFGIIMADYYLNRRGRLNVPELYNDQPGSQYYYMRGVNPRALAAFVPAALISAALALIPALSGAAAYSWFVGALVAAGCYRLLRTRVPSAEHLVEPARPALATEQP